MTIKLLDVEFLLRLNEEGGPILSGQSKMSNCSSHVRIDNDHLKLHGIDYLKSICKAIEINLSGYCNNQT